MKINKAKKVAFSKSSICLTLLSLGLLTNTVVHAQVQAKENPFSNVGSKTNGVAYNPNAANIDGKKEVVVPIKSNEPKIENIMSPGTAINSVQLQQIQAPVTPPAGMPVQEEFRPSQDKVDSTQTMINLLNASEDKIREINREMYKRGRVINELPVTPPKSVNDIVIAKLSPGSVAPVIRVFKNRTTSIILTDSMGRPWPIVNHDGLPDDDFTVKRVDNPAPDGYVLSITPKGAFVSGNLIVLLKGLPTPLNIEFVSAQKEVDGTTQIRVQALGPNSQFTSLGLPSGMDTELLSVLQGVAPQGSKELMPSSKSVQAWQSKDGWMYVRTRYKIMAPAFKEVSSSPDGTSAYKMVPVDVVLYKNDDGKFGEFTISGR